VERELGWEEYLKIFIQITRELYSAELTRDKRDFQELSSLKIHFFRDIACAVPCQIQLFEFPSINKVVFIITTDPKKPDAQIIVNEAIKITPSEYIASKGNINQEAKTILEFAGENWNENYLNELLPLTFSHVNSTGLLFSYNPSKTLHPRDLATKIFYYNRAYVLRAIYQSIVKESINSIIKKSEEGTTIDKLELSDLKKTFEQSIKKVEEQEEKIVSLQNNINGIQKLVGTETYGEWKVLLTEIDKLNNRIDCLSEVRTAYDKVLDQQTKVLVQQSNLLNLVKYAAILIPIAIAFAPVINSIVQHFLGF
jgi:hypothetical protein